jgi:hypothetical protein
LGSLPFKGLLQAAWTYQSAINYSFNGDPEGAQPGYHIVNLNVGVRGPDRRYEVVLFVNTCSMSNILKLRELARRVRESDGDNISAIARFRSLWRN